MLQRYLDSPVLMSFNSNPRPITEIPFPAVTICNMNKETFRFLLHMLHTFVAHQQRFSK